MEVNNHYTNQLILGDCIQVMKDLPAQCIDLVVTDPPYLAKYKDRGHRTILNDQCSDWVTPAFAEIYRLLKRHTFCISFYGWHKIDIFMTAWKKAGFRPVGHLVWPKRYASKSQFLAYQHESAYLLAKGRPPVPASAMSDIQTWHYTGNKLHPTQKSTKIIRPLITAFSEENGLVLDPFSGSGTTAQAARETNRRYLAIEKDSAYYQIAKQRLGC